MQNEKIQKFPSLRVREVDSAVERYEALKQLGKAEFRGSHVLKTGEVDESDIETAKRLFAKGITATNPEVFVSYFEHVIISAELARVIGDPKEEYLLWLHELGRLVTPAAYFRNDLIDDRFLFEFGLPETIRKELPSIRDLMEESLKLKLSEAQLRGEERLSKRQEEIAMDFFSKMTPIQRVVTVADNIGKRDEEGNLFTLQSFLRYIRSQEERYEEESPWASVDWATRSEEYTTDEGEKVITTRRKAGSILQVFLVEKAIDWLKQNKGIDFDQVLKKLDNYGPKFMLLVRHGDPDNPRNIVYNLDEVMKEEDRIHITDNGRSQLKALGMVIKKRKFRVARIAYSDQIRVVESEAELNRELGVSDEQAEPRLKDLYAPGAYLEGLTMDQWKNKKGNAYDKKRWGKYNHEEPESLIKRVDEVFWERVRELKVGQTTILLSHGDPIAWWINHQVTGQLPQVDSLRDQIYPNQGQAIVCIIDPQGNFFTHYILTDPNLIEGESY